MIIEEAQGRISAATAEPEAEAHMQLDILELCLSAYKSVTRLPKMRDLTWPPSVQSIVSRSDSARDDFLLTAPEPNLPTPRNPAA